MNMHRAGEADGAFMIGAEGTPDGISDTGYGKRDISAGKERLYYKCYITTND